MPEYRATAAIGGPGVDVEEPRPNHSNRALVAGVVAAGLVLAVAAVVVGVVVLRPDPDPSPTSLAVPTTTLTVSPAPTSASEEAGQPTGSLTSHARAVAPSTSPDGVDGAGNPTTYDAGQMLDGDPSTTWRMDGDGTGVTITFTLDTRRAVSTLGLINGYAKIDPATGEDRYAQSRRITQVTWTLDQTTFKQRLADGIRGPQAITFPAVTTRTVTLRLDAVTGPGDPQFNRTAISDVLIANG